MKLFDVFGRCWVGVFLGVGVFFLLSQGVLADEKGGDAEGENEASSESEWRVFTSADGKREMKARVVWVQGERVRIAREGGGEMTTTVDQFSEEDQEFFEDWEGELPPRLVKMEAAIVRKTESKEESRGAREEILTKKMAVEVGLKNRSGEDFRDLTVKYGVYYATPEWGQRKSEARVRVRKGEASIPELENFKVGTFRTLTVPIREREMDPRWVKVTPDGKWEKELEDTLLGIWFRVYDGEQLIFEERNSSKYIEEAGWAFKDEEKD